MKIAVVGSRHLGMECYPLIEKHIPKGCSEIISGGAVGIDTVSEKYAKDNDLKLTLFNPDYGKFDRSAPIIRNAEIVAAADFVLIIWDGKSRGSLNVIMTCMDINKPFQVVINTETN